MVQNGEAGNEQGVNKALLHLEGTGCWVVGGPDTQLGAGWEEAGQTQKLQAAETKGQTTGI